MRERDAVPVRRPNAERQSVARWSARVRDDAAGRGDDRRTRGARDVDSSVLAGELGLRTIEQERPQDGPVDRPRPCQRRTRNGKRGKSGGGENPRQAASVVHEVNDPGTVAKAADVVNVAYRDLSKSAFRDAPVRRATTAAACRRGKPALTSSMTASTAATSSTTASDAPSTSTISPFGGSVNL